MNSKKKAQMISEGLSPEELRDRLDRLDQRDADCEQRMSGIKREKEDIDAERQNLLIRNPHSITEIEDINYE